MIEGAGTWADLIEFPKDILTDDGQGHMSKLRGFVKAMAQGEYAPWIRFVPTYVRLDIGSGGEVVSAELCDHEP